MGKQATEPRMENNGEYPISLLILQGGSSAMKFNSFRKRLVGL